MWADAAALPCDENGKRDRHTTEMKQAAADGGNVLVVSDTRAEAIPEFIIGSTEPVG